MKQVMDIEKLNKFNLSKKVVKKFGAKQKAGSWKQETRTESRNLEGSKWCLWMYNCFTLLQYKQR